MQHLRNGFYDNFTLKQNNTVFSRRIAKNHVKTSVNKRVQFFAYFLAEFKQRKLDEIQEKLNQVSLKHANEVENLTVEHESELDLLRSELTEEHSNEIEQGKFIFSLKELEKKYVNKYSFCASNMVF